MVVTYRYWLLWPGHGVLARSPLPPISTLEHMLRAWPSLDAVDAKVNRMYFPPQSSPSSEVLPRRSRDAAMVLQRCEHHFFYNRRNFTNGWTQPCLGGSLPWLTHHLRQGSPIPGVPIRNRAAQQEVSGGRARERISICRSPSLPIACIVTWTIPSPLPSPWKSCLPWNWSLVPKSLGTADLRVMIPGVGPLLSLTSQAGRAMTVGTTVSWGSGLTALYLKLWKY